MADLRNVWVRSRAGHFIRADQILRIMPDVMDHAGWIDVLVPDERGMQTHAVLKCHEDIVIRAAGELAVILGRSANRATFSDCPALFIFPSGAADDEFQWTRTDEPPTE